MTAEGPKELPDRMTGGEFRMVRESLGLTTAWIADRLGVAERTVRRWDHGHSPVPEGVREQMEAWEADTARAVDLYVAEVSGMRDPAVALARDDEEVPHGWPARWQRHVAARVALEVPGLVVGYRDELDLPEEPGLVAWWPGRTVWTAT